MSNIGHISEISFKLSKAKIPAIVTPYSNQIEIKTNGDRVQFYVDGKGVQFDAATAQKIGDAFRNLIAKLEPGEMIILTLNGEKINIIKSIALKLISGLYIKAVEANNFKRRIMGK